MSPYPGKGAAAIVVTAFLSAAASAPSFCQDPCAPPVYEDAWVDPVKGNDSHGIVGNRKFPFRTITEASKALLTNIAGTGKLGLVNCLPGRYSPLTNGETLPIRMFDNVHVRGAGAKECVIRGVGIPNELAFLPYAPWGGIVPVEILVDFRTVLDITMETSSINGFTFTGGDVQVYFTSEKGPCFGRVSNCLFDMLHAPDRGVEGPLFGVLMNSPYLTPPAFVYYPCKARILQCTFIQGYRPPTGPVETARANAVAICDVTDNTGDPLVATGQAPYSPLRGIGKPAIHNNVIRSLPTAKRTALLGVDALDTQFWVIPGLPIPVPTNAFDPTMNGASGFDVTWTFQSDLTEHAAIVNVDLSKVDPSFVGEMVGDLNLQAGFLNTSVHDFRLLFDSPLVNRGRVTPFGGSGCTGVAICGTNGNTYAESLKPAIRHGCFGTDGEGFGNPRIAMSWAFPTLSPSVDMGFDETDVLIVAGSYGNGSKSHGNPWDSSVEFGGYYRWYLTPHTPDPVTEYYMIGTLIEYPSADASLEMPGTVPPVTYPKIENPCYVSEQHGIDLGKYPVVPLLWVNPIDNSVHALRYFLIGYDDTHYPVSYLTEQVAAYRFGTLYLSNLQSEHF